MAPNSGTVSTQRLLSWMTGWFALILLIEFATMPMSSHGNSWRAAWLSFAVLPASSYLMAKRRPRDRIFFLYGCAGALLFLFRFFGMGRFSLWLEYAAPGVGQILLAWVGFVLMTGLLCWGAVELRAGIAREGAGPPYDRRSLSIAHLFLWIACAAVYLAASRSSWSRIDTDDATLERTVIAHTAATSPAAGAALCGLLLFVARRYRNLPFPQAPGEFFLLAMGVLTAMWTTWRVTASFSLPEAMPAWSMAANLVASLVLVVGAFRVPQLPWRIWLIAEIASIHSSRIAWLIGSYLGIGMYPLDVCLGLLASAVLVVVLLRDYSHGRNYAWTHWAGVVTAFWLAAVSAGWIVWSLLSAR